MAQKHVTHLTDDIDGTEAHHTVRFGLEGKNYEIDLHDHHRNELRDALGRFISAARPVAAAHHEPARRAPRGSKTAEMAAKRAESIEVRKWANAHHKPVSERGRISAETIRAYEQATGVKLQYIR